MFVVLFGDLGHGYTVYGPFNSRKAAVAYAESDGFVMLLRQGQRNDKPAPGQIVLD